MTNQESSAYSNFCQDKSQTTSLQVRGQRPLVGNRHLEHGKLHNIIARNDFLKSQNEYQCYISTLWHYESDYKQQIIFDIWNLN